MSDTRLINDLTEGNVTKQLLKFSTPFILSNALQTVYALIDMIVVGQFVGSAGLSAISISSQLVWLLSAIGVGFGSGAQILISQIIGAKDHKSLSATIGTTFTCVTVLSLVFTFVGLVFTDGILRLMDTPPEAMEQARSYMMICSGGMFFTYGYNMVSAVLRGMGDSKRPLIFIAIASVVNLVLDLIFVAVFRWESAGAAWATIIGQAVSFIFSLIYLVRHRVSFGFDFKLRSFAVDFDKLKLLIKLGAPLSFQSIAINVSMLFVNTMINGYGVIASAIYGIGSKLNNLMFVITGAMNAASGSMIGQNFAAGKFDRIKTVFKSSIACCAIFGAVVSALVLLFPNFVFSLFTTDAEVLALAPAYSWVVFAFFMTFAFMSPSQGLISGVGNVALNFVIALADGVVTRILLSILLGRILGFGMFGFFWGNALAGLVSVIWGNIYYFSGKWKKRKALVSAQEA